MTIEYFQQDDSVRTYAICETELNPTYYILHGGKKEYEVFYFFIATIILPIISLMLTSTVVRSMHRSIHIKIIRKIHHQNVAGLILTGIFVTFYILACDICAVYFAYFGHNEISQHHHLKKTINYISTGLLLAFDGIVSLIPLTMILYICCKHVDEETFRSVQRNADTPPNEKKWAKYCCLKCNKCVSQCCLGCCLYQGLAFYFNSVFGTLNLDELWVEEDKKLRGFRLVWTVTLTLVAPLLAVSSLLFSFHG